MAGAVVVDTMIASAWLGTSQSRRLPNAVGACSSGRHVGIALHGGFRDALRSRGGWVGPAASGRVGDNHSRVAGAVGQELAVVVGTRLIEDRSIAKMVRSGRAVVRKAS